VIPLNRSVAAERLASVESYHAEPEVEE